MGYVKLIAGIGLILVFTWLLVKNSKRTGFMNALLRFDIIVGIIAGVYLVVASMGSLIHA